MRAQIEDVIDLQPLDPELFDVQWDDMFGQLGEVAIEGMFAAFDIGGRQAVIDLSVAQARQFLFEFEGLEWEDDAACTDEKELVPVALFANKCYQ